MPRMTSIATKQIEAPFLTIALNSSLIKIHYKKREALAQILLIFAMLLSDHITTIRMMM